MNSSSCTRPPAARLPSIRSGGGARPAQIGHHLLGEQLDLVVGGAIHLFQLSEHVVHLIALLNEVNDMFASSV
jgi:hypothetical protein